MLGNSGRTCAAVALSLVVAGCGGGEATPDSTEASGDFPVEVTRATFPERQNVAGTTDLTLAVKNAGDEEIPELAITVWTGAGGVGASKASGSFNVRTDVKGSDSRTLPVWVPTAGFPKLLEGDVTPKNAESAPSAGAEAAQTDTFAFGALEAQKSRTVVWRMTPVRPGTYTVHYVINAGLKGNAKAVTADGESAGGSFDVKIGNEPRGTCVIAADGSGCS